MAKTLTIQQALAATETELSKITAMQMSPAAKKSVQTALGLIRGTRTAYAAQIERLSKQAGTKQAGTTKIKEVPKSSVASPKESAEARRRRLLNSTATGAQVIRSANQKGKN